MTNEIGKAKKDRGKPLNTHVHHETIPLIVQGIIEQADIILEVLDARFIEQTRNAEIEKAVKKIGKPLIYVLNKSDLVDVNKIRQEKELHDLKPHIFLSTKERGSSNLRKLIKIESGKINKESVNVGVIGYPNTGKSSLIKLLAVKSKIRISPVSGFTKGIQKIKISKDLYLIDTPGVIPIEEKKSIAGSQKHSQIGAIDWNRTKDPEMIIHILMQENPNVFEMHYKADANGDSETLIEEVGKKLHFFKKGNFVDEVRTAKKILRDWQEGKIRV
jgi:hypothetical protein